MADFVTLTCPSCGGKLQITNDVERFACGHCGTEHIVRRRGGVISIAPVVEGLAKVQVGVDKTASELAIRRLDTEISQLQAQIHAIDTELARIPAKIASAKIQKMWGILLIIPGVLLYVWSLIAPFWNVRLRPEDFLGFYISVSCWALPCIIFGVWLARIPTNPEAYPIDETVVKKKQFLENSLSQKKLELQKHQRLVRA